MLTLVPPETAEAGPEPSSAASGSNWPAYLYGYAHSSDTAATVITPSNASSLRKVWNYIPTGNMKLGNKIYASPTVYDGQLYIGSQNGTFYDLNEVTGTVVWSHYTKQQPVTTCLRAFVTGDQGFVSTATVAPSPKTGEATVYVAAPDGYLYAWNAGNGRTLWRSVVGIPSEVQNDYFNWSSPTVANGKIYVGVSSNCDRPLVQGGEKVYDQVTGQLLATFDTTPPNDVGGSIWSSAMVDAAGSVYVTTGNSNDQGGPTGYSESIVRLDPNTLRPEDHWTIPQNKRIYDGDFGGSPTVWTADLSGRPTEMVGACNKNENYYALRASDLAAGPVWHDHIGGSEYGLCLSAAVWDQATGQLFLSGKPTTPNSAAYDGSVQDTNSATGAVIWRTDLPGAILGTPTLDGKGVLAVPTMGQRPSDPSGVYLIDTSNGKILATISVDDTPVYSQPVFAGNFLFVGTVGEGITAYRPSLVAADGQR